MATNTQFKILVIDDDELLVESLRLSIPSNWSMVALDSLRGFDPSSAYHAAFVDMHLTRDVNHAEGPEIIEALVNANPLIQVVAMSGDLRLELMERCLKAGALRFLAKPLLPQEVVATLEKIEAWWAIRQADTRRQTSTVRWVGQGEKSLALKKQIASLRGEPGPILLEGETGTGKEVICQLLNQQEGSRHLVIVNIASIPENLFESEMYGHVRGAFTGADSQKIGLAEAAHGGDLFLDEIEALPLSQQVKLLRFLETGEVRKVGSKDAIHVHTRVIVATNQKLETLVAEGKFREDLLFRVSGKKLVLPPLRERKEDIRELADYFLSLQRPRSNKIFSKEALDEFSKYSFPGNVRELKRICEQVSLTSPLPIIRDEDVRRLLSPVDEAPTTTTKDMALESNLSLGLDALLADYEARIFRAALAEYKSLDKVMEVLKVSRSSCYKKLKDHNINVGDYST